MSAIEFAKCAGDGYKNTTVITQPFPYMVLQLDEVSARVSCRLKLIYSISSAPSDPEISRPGARGARIVPCATPPRNHKARPSTRHFCPQIAHEEQVSARFVVRTEEKPTRDLFGISP